MMEDDEEPEKEESDFVGMILLSLQTLVPQLQHIHMKL